MILATSSSNIIIIFSFSLLIFFFFLNYWRILWSFSYIIFIFLLLGLARIILDSYNFLLIFACTLISYLLNIPSSYCWWTTIDQILYLIKKYIIKNFQYLLELELENSSNSLKKFDFWRASINPKVFIIWFCKSSFKNSI